MAWYLIELQYVPREVARVRPAHRRYMAELVAQGLVAFAGRYTDESAGLFLYRADDERELQPLMDNDYCELALCSAGVHFGGADMMIYDVFGGRP